MDSSNIPVIRLASASPRRQSLLASIGIVARVDPVDIDESCQHGETPERFVSRLAREKAQAGHRDGGLPTLGADTIVVCDEAIFGKPRDAAHARTMLEALSGRSHRVLSAVAVIGPCGVTECRVATTVHMRDIAETEIHAYWLTGEPADKAGGYAVQGRAAIFVERLEGSYSAVVGLPLHETSRLLSAQGVSAWPG